jgi:hypothetical protein
MAIYTQDLPNIFNMDKINTSFMIALRQIIKLYLQMSIIVLYLRISFSGMVLTIEMGFRDSTSYAHDVNHYVLVYHLQSINLLITM